MSKQGTLVYIEKENITEAEFMSRNFVNAEAKTRAFINTIGAEVVMKYLRSEGIAVNELYNLHSMSKVLEDVDIADILLPNIHIDVRTVFDKKQIFIPKSHFELGLFPDIYVVIIPGEGFNHAELLGYFTPDMINKTDANSEYYFIPSDKLSSVESLTKYIKDYVSKKETSINENEFLRGRELAVMMADHNISFNEKKELYKLLLASNSLRESVLEFDNFESLAFNTVEEMKTLVPTLGNVVAPKEIDYFAEFESDESMDNSSQENASEDDDKQQDTEESNEAGADNILEPEILDLNEAFFDDLNTGETDGIMETTLVEDLSILEQENGLSEGFGDFDSVVNEDAEDLQTTIHDVTENMSEDEMFKLLGDDESVPVSDDAIRLAGVAGDVLAGALENQHEHLEKFDYDNLGFNADEDDEQITSIVPSKPSGHDEHTPPTDLSNLQAVDIEGFIEPQYEHETIDLDSMQPVDSEYVDVQDEDSVVNFEHLSMGNKTSTLENVEAEEMLLSVENEVIDLPEVSTLLPDADYEEELALNESSLESLVPADIEEDFSEDSMNPDNEQMDSDIDGLNFNDLDDIEGLDSLDDELTLDIDEDELASTLQEGTTPVYEDLSEQPISPVEAVENEDSYEEKSEVLNDEDGVSDVIIEDANPRDENQETESDLSMVFPSEQDVLNEFAEDLQPEVIEDNADELIQEEFESTISEENEEINQSEEISDINYEEEPVDESVETSEFVGEIDSVEDVSTVTQPQYEPLGLENSTVISDTTFTVGEIPIDINFDNRPISEAHESLESLYNDELAGTSMLNTPGRTGKVVDTKKGLGFVGGLLVLVMVCGIGFGVAKLFKAPTEEPLQPITDDILPSATEQKTEPKSDVVKVNPDNVVKMDSSDIQNADTPKPVTKTEKNIKEKDVQAKSQKQKVPVTTFLEVSKLTWEVPDYVSYAPQFKQYFQAAGKSLKLSLTSDLLLATEPSYSKEIKVTIIYNRDGALKSAQILKSSGSTQIDNIVLQTVNQTLKVLKAPASVNNDENTTAILKIYF